MPKPKLLLIANNNLGHGLTGGDQIFINLVKFLKTKYRISVIGSPEAELLLAPHLKDVVFIRSSPAQPREHLTVFQLIIHQFIRTIRGVYSLLKHYPLLKSCDFVYSVSDFYPDLVPGFFTKLLNPRINWISGFYLFAPKPWRPDSPYNSQKETLKGWIYFLGQIPTRLITNLFADYVFITSDPDKDKFKSIDQKNIVVVRGGVDVPNYQLYKKSSAYIPIKQRKYDAVFLGRLHPQKGVIELVDIWKIVVSQKPDAKLAIIGDGLLEKKLLQKIKKMHLSANIKFFGFQIGQPKIKIFQNSRVVVHPAAYDSGGMASAEAMAWGLPGVSFDLPALQTYYPQGMIKTPCFDHHQFADNILILLKNSSTYSLYSKQALDLIKNHWSWHSRFDYVYKKLSS